MRVKQDDLRLWNFSNEVCVHVYVCVYVLCVCLRPCMGT